MKNIQESILTCLIFFGLGFLVIFGIVAGIQHSWISFWDYGDKYNETTMPPLVWWKIMFRVAPSSALIALIAAPVGVGIVYLITKD